MKDLKIFGRHPVKSVHFVGIGGIGMSGLARILVQSGVNVSGSDIKESKLLDDLRGLGIRVQLGHYEENLGDAQIVVTSSAICSDNVELNAARQRGTRILHRSEVLARFMASRIGIAVSGTHGKTTTSSMLAIVLNQIGVDPTIIVGAEIINLKTNGLLGSGPYAVCEADESDKSFLNVPAVFKIVTNIDTDHMDVYQNFENLKSAFLEFMNSIPFYGLVIICFDDLQLRDLTKKVHRRVVTYGLNEGADVSARHLKNKPFGTVFTCFQGEQKLGTVELNVPGRHNVQNALAVISVGLWIGLSFNEMARSLASFQGAERRQQFKGERGGVSVIDDYAHHPTEIKATLECLRSVGERMIVVFQPHRYTRTKYLIDLMGECFVDADRLFVLPVYGAGEEPIPGIDSKTLVSRISPTVSTTFVEDTVSMVNLIRQETRPGDLVVTMGAGDVWQVGEKFLG